jgi:hypothetical protein
MKTYLITFIDGRQERWALDPWDDPLAVDGAVTARLLRPSEG